MRVKSVCAVLVCALLCGCWDKRELNERGFVNGIALDMGEAGFSATVALYDIEGYGGNGEAGNEEKNKNVKSAEGRTASEALKKTGESSARELFFGHSKAVIIGEKLAGNRQLLKEALDALERDRELSRKNYVFISEGEAAGVISQKPEGEPSAGVFADKRFGVRVQGETFPMNLEELFISLRNCGNALVPKISAEKEELKLSGAAVIKAFALCGFLNGEELRGCLWLAGDTKGTRVTAAYNGGNVTVTVLRHRKRSRFTEDAERLIMETEVNADVSVDAYILGRELGDKEKEEIERAAAKEIEKEIARADFALRQELEADALDIKGLLKKKDYALWLKHGKSWEKSFKEMRADTNVAVSIKGAGRIK